MPANRSLIHINKINEFKTWLKENGWIIEETKGIYEVIRARKMKYLIIYHKKNETDHLTIPFGMAQSMAKKFINYTRQCKYG